MKVTTRITNVTGFCLEMIIFRVRHIKFFLSVSKNSATYTHTHTHTHTHTQTHICIVYI